MSNISSNQIFAWIERYAAHIAEQKDYLTQLDAAIGDADHGANMHRGLQAVLAKKADLQNADIGALLKGVAMTLISTVGGASGALYGTFFLQASTMAGSSDRALTERVRIIIGKRPGGNRLTRQSRHRRQNDGRRLATGDQGLQAFDRIR